MRLNHDIWEEIISHLYRPRDKHALALTSRGISSLALDALWRNCGQSRAFLSVINSSSPPPDEPFLQKVEGYEGDAGDGDEGPGAARGRRIGAWVRPSYRL